MQGTLERVKQTHKTILFESFNGWQKNIFNLAQLLNGKYSDVDDKIDKISRLEVHSFKEFLEKFSPKIYETIQETTVTKPDGSKSVMYNFDYSLDDTKGTGIPMKLEDHGYFKMLSGMYGAKRTSGQSNRDFDDSILKEILTPKSEEKEELKFRKRAELLAMQYAEAVNKKENANVYAKQIIEFRKEIEAKKNSPAIVKLAMRVSNINNRIHFLEKQDNANKALPPGNEDAEVTRGILDFDDDGKPIVKALPASSTVEGSDSTKLLTAASTVKMLKAAVEEGLAADENLSSFTQKMIVSNYLPADSTESFDLTPAGVSEKLVALKEERDICENMYVQAQSSFIKVLKQIATRVLGVKAFFDHATIKGGEDGVLPKGAGLLVTNCSVRDLLGDEKTKAEFEKFIFQYGKNETGNKKLWIGILPHVICGEKNLDEQYDDENIDPFKFDINDVEEKNSNNIGEPATLTETKQLLSIMQNGGVLTVFNAAVDKDVPFTFGGINKKTIDEIREKFADFGIDFDHAVFAYPNFTIISESKSKIFIDDRDDAPSIDVNSILIDAAYVAAGLIVASQQPEFLIRAGFNGRVDKQSVCVRLNLEDEEISAKLLTHFNRELSGSWEKDIVDAISDDRFGFVFSGDLRHDRTSNKYLENSYIFSARTMSKKDGIFQPIYKTLTKDFILGYLKTIAPKISKREFNNFLNQDVKEWVDQMKRGENDGIINTVLKKGDSISKSSEGSGKLRVALGGGDTLIDVEIEKE